MALSPVSPVINRGIASNWLEDLPPAIEMLTVDADGNVSHQAIPVASFAALTGAPGDNTALAAALAAKLGGSTGSVTNRVLTANGTGGATVQASPVTVDASGNVSGIANLTMGNTLTLGSFGVFAMNSSRGYFDCSALGVFYFRNFAGTKGFRLDCETTADTVRFRTNDGSAAAAIDCGAMTASGTVTGSQAIASASYVYGQPQFRSTVSAGAGFQVVTAGSCAIYGNATAVMAVNDDVNGVRIDGNRPLGFVPGHALSNAADVTLRRNATGPALETRSAGGLRVRNADGSAAGPVDCQAITASGNIALTGSNPQVRFGAVDQGYVEYSSGALNLGHTYASVLAVAGDRITCLQPFQTRAYTVATLPSASAHAGREVQVTDSSVTTYRSIVAGGGSDRVKLLSDGTNWRLN